MWLYCEAQGRKHHAAMAVAPLVIRWGADGSIGWKPFPVEQMTCT